MTEEEAKTKWCPYRAQVAQTITHKGVDDCFASDCMMWSWTDHKGNICNSNDYNGQGRCGLTNR